MAYFGFVAELREPRDFKKSLFLMQGFMTPFYIMSAVLIYYYCGPNVPSPSITAASPIVAKIAYGVACPTIVIAGVINGHVAFKSIYIRVCPDLVHETSARSKGAWAGICGVCWVAAWLIAEMIPSFHQLLALVVSSYHITLRGGIYLANRRIFPQSALFMGWFSYGISGCFWLHMNRGKYLSMWRKTALTCLNIFIVAIGCVIVSKNSAGYLVVAELTPFNSAVWASMRLLKSSWRAREVKSSLVRIRLRSS